MSAVVVVDTTAHLVNTGDSVTIIPKFDTKGFSSDLNTFLWTIGEIKSNFSESPVKASTAICNALTPLDQEHIAYEVSDISEGEVVWIPISITVSDGIESASQTFTQSARRGKPVTEPIIAKAIKDGRICQIPIYEDSIEGQLCNQNGGYLDDLRIKTGGTSIQEAMACGVGDFVKNETPFRSIGIRNHPSALYAKEHNYKKLTPQSDAALKAVKSRKGVGYNAPPIPANHDVASIKPIYFDGRSVHMVSLAPPNTVKNFSKQAQPIYMPYPEPIDNDNDECSLCNAGTTTWTVEEEHPEECIIVTKGVDYTETTTCE